MNIRYVNEIRELSATGALELRRCTMFKTVCGTCNPEFPEEIDGVPLKDASSMIEYGADEYVICVDTVVGLGDENGYDAMVRDLIGKGWGKANESNTVRRVQ